MISSRISVVDDPATLGRLNEALEAVLNKAQVGVVGEDVVNVMTILGETHGIAETRLKYYETTLK